MTGKYDAFFKAYDVRGEIPEIDEKLFYLSGKGFVEEILMKQGLPLEVNISYDARIKSEHFSRYFAKGIEDAGGSVIYLGIGSTDFMYAACVKNDKPGVQLTASHNPKNYHGFKVVKRAPEMVGLASGLSEIRDYVNTHIDDEIPSELTAYTIDDVARNGVKDFLMDKMHEVGAIDSVNHELEKNGRKLKVVVDCGNGAGGVFMPWVEALYPNIEFIRLYWELDGMFPNHPADPQTYENLADLQAAVLEHSADFGIAFDGDADRAGIIDEKGEIVGGDYLTAAFSTNFLNEYKHNSSWQEKYNPVVVTIQPNSRCVWDAIGEADGVGVICKQGHTFVKAEMAKYNGLYGGEYSNHHYFGQLKGMDSGALPLALIVKMYVLGGYSKLSTIFEKLQRDYFVSKPMNFEIPEGVTWADWKALLKAAFKDGTTSELDGLSVYYPDWKFAMRASNTEPVIRFILETRGSDMRDHRVAEVKRVLGLS